VHCMVKTPILLIFCANIPCPQRSSEHLLFLLGRQYLPTMERYALLKFPRKLYLSGLEGAITSCLSVVLLVYMLPRLCTVQLDR
jgi:hypothetical protein